jgi:hypothetical protein
VIGDSCDSVFEVEITRDSHPIRPLSEDPADGLFGFTGTHDGREVLIGYICSDGFITSQLISFKLDTDAEANALFDDQYDKLLDLFGPPCTDWRKLTLWQRFKIWYFGFDFPELLTRVDWTLENDLQANLDSGPMGPGPDYWSVSIDVSGPPVVLVREQDGTERRLNTPKVCLHRE